VLELLPLALGSAVYPTLLAVVIVRGDAHQPPGCLTERWLSQPQGQAGSAR
jgi:hypothetical protein